MTIPSYTEAQVNELKQAYSSAESDSERKEVVKLFAGMFNKTTNSIVAKLSNMKVYIKPAKVSKTGSAIVRKAELVNQIADAMGEDAEVLESLEKATKIVLEKILKAVS